MSTAPSSLLGPTTFGQSVWTTWLVQ